MTKYFITGLLVSLAGAVYASSSWEYNLQQKDTGKHITQQPLFLADPTIFYDQGRYYLYGTHATDSGFEVYVSTDLIHWKERKTLALSKDNSFGNNGFWAPQVFKYKNKYYMAYTANEHIAIAVSNSPSGPFRQKKKTPLMTDRKTIDPFVFIDGERKYLYYVKLENGNRIFVAELKDDFSGIKPQTERSCINAVTDTQAWEDKSGEAWTVTEGPTVLRHKGNYYLFYSANDFRSIDYAVGYAVADNPSGPWKKYSGNPVLSRNLLKKNGPGHGDFFKGKNGQYYYVFHTHFSSGRVSPRRTAIIQGNFISQNGGLDKMKFDKNSFHYLHTK